MSFGFESHYVLHVGILYVFVTRLLLILINSGWQFWNIRQGTGQQEKLYSSFFRGGPIPDILTCTVWFMTQNVVEVKQLKGSYHTLIFSVSNSTVNPIDTVFVIECA